ncbi:hypothetical protein EI94DRAFT_1799575 [Lactarius quietus]|nr:hypothetical protein EI94DRAFT_1799575 [Lactarius quietus]
MAPPVDWSWGSPKSLRLSTCDIPTCTFLFTVQLPTIGLFHILVLLLVVHCLLSLFYSLVGSTSANLLLVILGLSVAYRQ